MENFEQEYRDKMDALCSKADVLDFIKSHAYNNVIIAKKAVSRPLKSILVTVVPIVLVCCFFFIISFNPLTPPMNNSEASSASNNTNKADSTSDSSNAVSSTSDYSPKNTLLYFGNTQPMDYFSKVFRIDSHSTVYSEYPGIKFKKSNEYIALAEALEENLITIDDIISKMKYTDEANDGGSKVYEFTAGDNDLANISFTLIQCNTLSGNRNILIGRDKYILSKNPETGSTVKYNFHSDSISNGVFFPSVGANSPHAVSGTIIKIDKTDDILHSITIVPYHFFVSTETFPGMDGNGLEGLKFDSMEVIFDEDVSDSNIIIPKINDEVYLNIYPGVADLERALAADFSTYSLWNVDCYGTIDELYYIIENRLQDSSGNPVQ
jgi:hypothetical protein